MLYFSPWSYQVSSGRERKQSDAAAQQYNPNTTPEQYNLSLKNILTPGRILTIDNIV